MDLSVYFDRNITIFIFNLEFFAYFFENIIFQCILKKLDNVHNNVCFFFIGFLCNLKYLRISGELFLKFFVHQFLLYFFGSSMNLFRTRITLLLIRQELSPSS
ncbi:MAG: hypothetical protein OP8BY_0277 [Candidatus Saccharicenans subterraneus]|uniref:Uncharacterized protein n=1 Tax=Candidatus Saccharicenans subterraneus TaxID=2508984 RepID=A0A3E2BL76_9BACT|nr:MAG: hypothetical protein OP8BY_0277 [Candidatus Saccharicenans subterraneum]